MALTTTITLGLAALDRSVHTSIEARQQQKKALGRQQTAQKQAEAAAIRQQRLSAEAYAAANRRQPDIGDIMATESELSRMGAAGTQLTGPQGVRRPPGQPTSLLGE